MTAHLTPATITRLEKAAVDNGFDQELPRQGDWLGFASTQAPLRLWLSQLRAKTSSTFAFAFATPSISLRFWLAGDVRRVILS